MAESCSLDDFKRWKVPELMEFLRKRSLKAASKKDELCSLVYAAYKVCSWMESDICKYYLALKKNILYCLQLDTSVCSC